MRARRRRSWLAGAVALAAGLVGVAAAPAVAATPPRAASVVTIAESPGASPNYVFPFMSCQYFSVANLEHFQQLLYRPLYWFGLGASTAVQPALSPAALPTFSAGNTTVSITMKGWHFSNGDPVDAASAQFFLNMYHSNPTAFCPYNPGYGIPDDVTDVTHVGNVLTLTLDDAVNPTWFLDDYLSQVTPMPRAWDKTSTAAASGSGHCGSGDWANPATTTSCRAVEHFLATQGAMTSTFTGPLWSVVDGPYRIASFDGAGDVSFVRNGSYSGPKSSSIPRVSEVAFKSATAELNALVAGRVDVGYVDPTSLPGPAPAPGRAGRQLGSLAARYRLVSSVPWAFDYAPFNFARSDPDYAEVSQPYLRQALQGTVSELSVIRSEDNGYGAPSCSPLPPTTATAISAAVGCAYPYDPPKYRTLLTTHGWAIHKGAYVCAAAGVAATQCGRGIAKGAPLGFAMIWEAGQPALNKTLLAEVAGWKSFGITVTHATGSLAEVISQCHGGVYAMCAWAGGWTYAPGYYPSGEALLTPRGTFDVGAFSDPKMTSLVAASTAGAANLTSYAQYASRVLPALYLPVPTTAVEVSTKLRGVLAPSPLDDLTPEYLQF